MARRTVAGVLLAALLAGGCHTAHRGVVADEAFELELVALMRSGIETLKPNTAGHLTRGRPTQFDGSYDWHSCVIAHWALSISARRRGDAELKAWLAPRLTRALLEAESALLVDPDAFGRVTWPYDEAWFCLLLAERDRSGDSALADLRHFHERRLVEALELLPFPDPYTFHVDPRASADGVAPKRFPLFGPVCGSYRSWLWAWIALGWCSPLDADVRARHTALWDERVGPRLAELLAADQSHGYDFLWTPALAALSAHIRGVAVDYTVPPIAPLPDAVVVATVHPLGVHLSQGWPVAEAPAGARQTYEERRDTLRARHDLWAEKFDASSHWLPQYFFIGEWLAAGRP